MSRGGSKDHRDWRAYNEELVVKGEFYLDFEFIFFTSVTRAKIPSRDPNIRYIDLVAIVHIEFFDRPPPFSIDLEAWNDLKRDVLSVCSIVIEKENEEKRQLKVKTNRFTEI